jgi:nicotinate-nucleotide adenylyltransferase
MPDALIFPSPHTPHTPHTPLPPTPSMQVALFGTSADPPTIAHREIIGWLGAYFDRVAVWAADNPYKAHGASLAQRSHMLELLIGEIEPEIGQHAQVYPELSSRRSIESVDRAKQIWHEADFILVVGADLLAQLPQWYRVDELLSQVKLLVVPRSGNSIDPHSIDTLLKLGAKVAIAPLATPPVSSTIVRTNHSHLSPTESAKLLAEPALEGLTPAVAKYIQAKELYSDLA